MWPRSSMTTSSPGRVWSLTAIWLPIEPVGTKSAASFSKSSAARSCRRLTVGSSPYTSSPTSASAIARRMAGVGLVTVSLRRSIIVCKRSDERRAAQTSDEGGEDFVREQRAGGRQPEHVAVEFDQAGLAEAREVCGVLGAHVQTVERAVRREVYAAAQQAQPEEERLGPGLAFVQLVERDDRAALLFYQLDVAPRVALVRPARAAAVE